MAELKKIEDRKAFNFFRSYWDIGKMLSDADRLAFYDAILKRQFTKEETKLTGLAEFAYVSQKHNIDNQINGYETNGLRGKIVLPTTGASVGGSEGAIEGASVQVKDKDKDKDEVKENNIDAAKAATLKRISDFKESLYPYCKPKGIYDKEMVKNFFDYWSETNKSGKKMRWELEKTFEVSKRLATWAKNEYNFGSKNKNSTKQTHTLSEEDIANMRPKYIYVNGVAMYEPAPEGYFWKNERLCKKTV